MDEGLTLKFCTSILRIIITEAIFLDKKMNPTSVSLFTYVVNVLFDEYIINVCIKCVM